MKKRRNHLKVVSINIRNRNFQKNAKTQKKTKKIDYFSTNQSIICKKLRFLLFFYQKQGINDSEICSI